VETTRRALVALPEAAALVVLALAISVSVLVTAGAFRPWLLVPWAVLMLALLWWLRRPGADAGPVTSAVDSDALPAAVALVGVAVWTAVQLAHTGEYVTVDRDPAVYALTGIWLIDNPSVVVPTAEAAAAADGINGARTAGLGFGGTTDRLSPEFAHTLPGLAAVGGWLADTRGVLAANVVIAGVALLAVYALGRRLVGAWWALLPPVGLALAMPLVAFARGLYTEPLALAMAAAGVSVLLVSTSAAQSSRSAPTAWRSSVLAGLLLGAAGLARVDGALFIVGAVVAIGVSAVVTDVGRRTASTHLLAVAVPAVVLVGLGLLDIARNSGNYLSRHADEAAAVLVAMAVAGAVAGVLIWFASPLSAWIAAHRRPVGTVAAAGVGAVSVLLLSRPWWYEGRFFAGSPRFVRDIERRQREEGLPIDGARSYDELTLDWVAWYHGWPIVLAALAGLSLMAWLTFAHRRYDLGVVLVTLGVPALAYVVLPAITPDHVWAMRRLVLAAVPLLLISATSLLAWVAERAGLHSRGRGVGALVAVGAVVATAGWPLLGWSGLHPVRDRVGQLAEAEAVCAQATDGRLVIAGGVPGVDYLPTARILCDAQVVALTDVSAASLALLRRAWGDEPLALVTYDRDAVPWTSEPVEPVRQVRLRMWERSLTSPPQEVVLWRRTLWSGVVSADGSVVPR
jgi:hypothetical protein